MRLTTAFNRILQMPGVSVRAAAFTDQGLIIGLRRRRRRLLCPCGATTRARYDSSRRRWRHLDFGACQVWLEADIHRIDCYACRRVRTEEVPWARPNARHSSDFENVVASLAQRMDKTSISRLFRCSWEAVDAIIVRAVIDHIDDNRVDRLYRIGVDEISYKRGQKYLTIVANHDTGNVVWVGKERSKAAFEEFFTALGPRRAAAIEAISLDGSSVYLPVTREQIPQARICLDPFHVIKWTNEVVDSVYGAESPKIPRGHGLPSGREWRRTRHAVRAGQENLDQRHRKILGLLRRHRYRLWRTWELKEQLRDLYRIVGPARRPQGGGRGNPGCTRPVARASPARSGRRVRPAAGFRGDSRRPVQLLAGGHPGCGSPPGQRLHGANHQDALTCSMWSPRRYTASSGTRSRCAFLCADLVTCFRPIV
ncbi:MAG TPA: ISL3 family transposase [Mycobacterium sp.]|nr:ISL3 family transposase [Mycobacterium sp.]